MTPTDPATAAWQSRLASLRGTPYAEALDYAAAVAAAEFRAGWEAGVSAGRSDFDEPDCPNCGGTGYSHHECGENSCCCLNPEDNVVCAWCEGRG